MRLKMTGRAMVMAACVAAMVSACKDEGGELRDVTARRRAELANRDTTRDHATDGDADSTTRLPAFAGDTAARTAVVTRDSAAADTPKAAAAPAWGTAPRQGGTPNVPTTLRGVQAASNPEGFDRMVLEFG